ncbi:MAG: glycosyltransferase family 4 protein [Rhodopirellula sp.]|nr:glycosyltransferase family 4 protein [Rhodopirellula sp.]
MKILMFYPGQVHHLPPLMTSAAAMARLGARVRVVAFSAAEPSARYLRERGIELSLLREGHPRTATGKAALWSRSLIRLYFEERRMQPDCVWLHQSHFISWHAWIPRTRSRVATVVHSHEFTSHVWRRWMSQKALARRADVVICPEQNRALILKHFSGSSGRVVIVPNRPANDMLPSVSVPVRTADVFHEAGGAASCSRFLIYQGAFGATRCLEQVVDAFRLLSFPDAGLILMGGDPDSDSYQKLVCRAGDDGRIVLLPRIAPPAHLEITRGCVGGIVLYSPTTLNNIYCAPNKIYEYASFGLGMVLPDYPGLAGINEQYRLGVTCNPTDSSSIAFAMRHVLQTPREEYQEACRRFLNTFSQPEDTFRKLYSALEEVIHEKTGRQWNSETQVSEPIRDLDKRAEPLPDGIL